MATLTELCVWTDATVAFFGGDLAVLFASIDTARPVKKQRAQRAWRLVCGGDPPSPLRPGTLPPSVSASVRFIELWEAHTVLGPLLPKMAKVLEALWKPSAFDWPTAEVETLWTASQHEWDAHQPVLQALRAVGWPQQGDVRREFYLQCLRRGCREAAEFCYHSLPECRTDTDLVHDQLLAGGSQLTALFQWQCAEAIQKGLWWEGYFDKEQARRLFFQLCRHATFEQWETFLQLHDYIRQECLEHAGCGAAQPSYRCNSCRLVKKPQDRAWQHAFLKRCLQQAMHRQSLVLAKKLFEAARVRARHPLYYWVSVSVPSCL